MAVTSGAHWRCRAGLHDYYNVPEAECTQAQNPRGGRRVLA